MAVFWVQHYYTLPIVFEDIGMGDEPPLRQNIPMSSGDGNLQRGVYLSLDFKLGLTNIPRPLSTAFVTKHYYS